MHFFRFRDNSPKQPKEVRVAQEKAESLGLKISKIVLGNSNKQSADKTAQPAQSSDFMAEVTEDLRKNLSNHEQLERVWFP